MKLNLTSDELEAARKILAARERRARDWRISRYVCLVAVLAAIIFSIVFVKTSLSVSADHAEMLTDASPDAELSDPATIADLNRLRRKLSFLLMTISIPALCHTLALFCACLAVWLLGSTITKWRQHDEDALTAKLLRCILAEENPNNGVQQTGAADGPSS